MPGMTDRDNFAAAALTGLLASREWPIDSDEAAHYCYRVADAMLRERERTNHDAAPAARASVGRPRTDNADLPTCAGTGDTPEIAAYRRFVGEVMNWISEATSAADWSSDGGRKILADACSRCWDAFDRIAYPTVHGASPEARAESDEDRADKAATSHRRDGTGDTPKPIKGGVPDRPKPIASEQEPVAWGVAGHKGLLYATAISRMDAVDMQSEHECDTEIVPLYRHPPVTEPMPKEKRAEVADRSKPITGPDPDSRVWETHTPATHATPGEGSVPREGTEPVAWAVMLADGERIYDVYATEEEAKAIDEAVTGNHGVVPLYRHPPCQDFSQKNLTLTDAEREAVERAVDSIASTMPYESQQGLADWKTLRGLLRRMGGGR